MSATQSCLRTTRAQACFEAGRCIADAFGRAALSPPVGQNFVLNLRSGLQSSPAHAGAPCGFAPANKGHDTNALQAYLGHRNIQHTVRSTELSPGRFKDFWR